MSCVRVGLSSKEHGTGVQHASKSKPARQMLEGIRVEAMPSRGLLLDETSENRKGSLWLLYWFFTHWKFYTHFWQAHIWSSLVQSWSLSAYCTSLTPANIKLERILEAQTVFGCQKRITLGITCRHLKTDSLHQMLWLPTIRKYKQSTKGNENERMPSAVTGAQYDFIW